MNTFKERKVYIMTRKNALGFISDKKVIANKTTILHFGQYKGQSVAEVMRFDASYLLWAIDNVDSFDIDDVHLIDEIIELDERQYVGPDVGDGWPGW